MDRTQYVVACNLVFKHKAQYEGCCLAYKSHSCNLCFVVGVKVINAKVVRVLVVEPEDHPDAQHNDDHRVHISPPKERWLGDPQESKKEQERRVSHVVNFLHHSINVVEEDKPEGYEDVDTRVDQLFGLEVLTIELLVEPRHEVCLLLPRLAKRHNDREHGTCIQRIKAEDCRSKIERSTDDHTRDSR